MLRGLSTVNLVADDVPAAAWCTELLGNEPYFERPAQGAPAYVESRIGIVDSRFAARGRSDKRGGAVIYWHVDDVEAGFERLVSMGATMHQKPIERGACTTSITWRFFGRCGPTADKEK
jgi:hypothetical protein